MAFRVFQIPDQGAYFVVLIVCALSSVAAVALRFLATHRSQRKAGAEDWLSLAALLLFLARIGVMLDCKDHRIQDMPQIQGFAKYLVEGELTFLTR